MSRSAAIAWGALLFLAAPTPTAPKGPATEQPVEVAVRFEVEGLPLPTATTFPRLPAGLRVALIPEVRMGDAPFEASRGRGSPPPPGVKLRWLRIEPAQLAVSNLQRDRDTGAQRIAATPLRSRAMPIEVADPWRVDADQLARQGTVRFQVVVDLPGRPWAASTPGPQSQYELTPGVAGGLAPEVLGLTRRPGEDLAGIAAELAGLPFLLNPLGDGPLHQSEQRVGTDCTSTFIYALRRQGFTLDYLGPSRAWPYLQKVMPGLRAGADGLFRDASGRPVELGRGAGATGDLLHFGNQLSLLVQDRWPFGVLDRHDLLLQTWRSGPRRVTVEDSEYAHVPADLVRFRKDLPRQAGAGLVVQVEDSHAGSFFHLRSALEQGPATLVYLDDHADADQNAFASELPHHRPTAAWERRVRDQGTVQCFDWVDALLPWGVDRALWVGPWDDADRAQEEAQARRRLCGLTNGFPDHGFTCRDDRLAAATLDEVLLLPADTPVVLSIDLDFFLRANGAVDPRRAEALVRILEHLTRIRAVSVALSRPWFPDAATFERALRLLSAALWTSPRIGAVEVDLSERQQRDRSAKVKALTSAGQPVPRPLPEQIEATPGLRLVRSPAHASFALLGDVYLSDAAAPVPPLPFDLEALPSSASLVGLANLETPVDDSRPVQGYPHFNRHAELLDRLASAGVLLVNLANNHALDQGPDGLEATIRAARERGIGVVGAWLPGEASAGVERLRIGDFWVSVLGVTYGLNGRNGFEGNVELVPFQDYPQTAAAGAAEARFMEKVRSAAQGSDLVVVLVHGGVEYAAGPSLGQRRFFAALAQAGAQVIAGTHSHRTARWEERQGALMAWGLGDVFPRAGTSGRALRVTAERGQAGISYRVEPLARRR